MIVDPEGAANGHGVVNVCLSCLGLHKYVLITMQIAKRKMEMLFVRGDGVILVECPSHSEAASH